MKKRIFVILIAVTIILNLQQPSHNIGKAEDAVPPVSIVKPSNFN